MKIFAISGSLRKQSYNAALLRAFVQLAPSDTELEIADLSVLPLYNQDDEAVYPAVVQAFKDKILAADALIIATPEYDRGIPGVLKNAIDWASRPYGKNAFAGKPILVAGVSSGKIGTAIAQSQLKHTLLYLEANLVGQPELYLGPAKELFDEAGNLISDSTKELLTKALAALGAKIPRDIVRPYAAARA